MIAAGHYRGDQITHRLAKILMAVWTCFLLYSCFDTLGVFDGTFREPTSAAGKAGFAIARMMDFVLWAIPMIILGLIAIFTRPRPGEDADIGDTQTCSFCAERIKAEATVCRFCGRDVVGAKT